MLSVTLCSSSSMLRIHSFRKGHKPYGKVCITLQQKSNKYQHANVLLHVESHENWVQSEALNSALKVFFLLRPPYVLIFPSVLSDFLRLRTVHQRDHFYAPNICGSETE